ncbi:MAG: hypothetical protein WCP45_18125 [Verrucomicrobiota bacterium]
MNHNSEQVSRMLEPQEGEESVADDGLSPRMPFPTSYMLSREQEDELCAHAMRRLEELEGESGRLVCGNGQWWGDDAIEAYQGESEGLNRSAKTWMGKRHVFDKTFKTSIINCVVVN